MSLEIRLTMSLEHWCWLALAACALHIVEEFILDWRGWVKGITGIDVSLRAFWTLNSIALVLGMACASVATRWPPVALAIPALMLINATFFHVGAVLFTRGRFSPGLITALLLFYPIAFFCFKTAHAAGQLTLLAGIGSFTIAVLVMGIPIFLLKAREKQRPKG